MKKILITTFAFFLIANLFSFNFEKAGIRNFSMGNTGIAQSFDASAAVYNPALLAHIKEFSLLTDNRIYLYELENDQLSYNSVIVSVPLGTKFSSAFSSDVFQSDLYQELHLGLHAGTFIRGDRFKAGIGLNYFNAGFGSNIYTANDPLFVDNDDSSTAIDFDLGFAYLVNNRLQFGLVGRNLLQSKLAIDSDDTLAREIGFGATFSIIPQWLIATDLVYTSYNEEDFDELIYSFGTEYRLSNNLALRGGLNNTDLSFGFGFLVLEKEYLQKYRDPLNNRKMVNSKSIALSVDYGFSYPVLSDMEIPYGNHFVGLELKFGSSTTDEDKLASQIPPRIQTEFIKEPMKAIETPQLATVDTLYIEIEKIIKDTVYVVDTLRVFTGISTDEYLRKSKELDAVKLELKDYQDLNKALIHITNATKYYYQSDLVKAVAECRAAIRLAPNMALAYIKLGSIYYRMDEKDKAFSNWRKAKAIDPNNPELKAVFRE